MKQRYKWSTNELRDIKSLYCCPVFNHVKSSYKNWEFLWHTSHQGVLDNFAEELIDVDLAKMFRCQYKPGSGLSWHKVQFFEALILDTFVNLKLFN